jgi:hypothetical protein
MNYSERLAHTLMTTSAKYTRDYLALMSYSLDTAFAYRPRKAELPLFESANYFLARTDQLFDQLSIEENEFIDLIVELRPMFRAAFRGVDPNEIMSECITSRQNQYGPNLERTFEQNEGNNRLHPYLNRLLLRAETAEALYVSRPGDAEPASSANKIRPSRTALGILEAEIVADYLSAASALTGRGAN